MSRVLPPAREWWIVETLEYGRTAMPGRVLAYQGAEVCRGMGLKVLTHGRTQEPARMAVPGDIGDELAVKQSKEELMQAQLNLAHQVGALAEQYRRPTQVNYG